MIQFHFFPSTSPMKVAILLEELGLEYEMVPVEIRKGEQFDPAYLALNPNAKAPALVDGDVRIFDSSAIMLYLAEKTGRFLSRQDPVVRAQLLSWLMFIGTGVAPYSGQAIYFKYFADEATEDALNRYMYEAERHWGILDARLGEGRYMLGEDYTILDMAVWALGRALPRLLGDDTWERYPNLKRLVDEISARPAAARAEALPSRHAFKMEMDADATRHMFRYRQPAARTYPV